MMSPLCLFFCYLNATLFLTSCILGIYIVFHIFIADRLFWRIYILSFFIAGCIRFSGLYKALIAMIIDPHNYHCFYHDQIIVSFSDTFVILLTTCLYIFFLVSGNCSQRIHKKEKKFITCSYIR
jgi:hypothetical protein